MAPTRALEYFAGYDFQNYSGRDDVLLIEQNTETVHAVFGQVRTTRDLFAKGTIAAGARYNAPTNSQSAAVWNVTGRYDFTGNTFARATVGTAFRYPDAYELFAIDPTCCFGNPNLKPERSTNFNGSFGHRFLAGSTALTLEAIGFYRRVNDLIADVDDGSGETTITANRPDQVRVRGVTLVGSVAASSTVSGSLSYTYTKSQRSNELAGGYDAIAGIPENQVDAFVRHSPHGTAVRSDADGERRRRAVQHGLGLRQRDGRGLCGGGPVRTGLLRCAAAPPHQPQARKPVRQPLHDGEWRGFPDASSTPFLVHHLGTPRTFHVSYSFSY